MEESRQVAAILTNFEPSRDELLPALEKIQDELGYLSYETMEQVALYFQVPKAEIYGVATFYQQFRLTPRGKYVVCSCQGTACHLAGGKLILEALSRELGIAPGQTTADGDFSLEEAACFGCCNIAPVIKLDGEIVPHLTPGRIEEILINFRERRKKEP
jgi:NADH-quinone oxidoreductase subunit E